MDMGILLFVVIPILVVVVISAVVGFFWLRIKYRTAKSNEALIITGPKLGDADKETNIFTDDEGRSMKIIRGGGYRLKMFQTSTPVNLTSFQLKLETPKVYTNGGVPIIADAVAMIKVADSLKGIANYAEQFLGKEQEEIEREIVEVLGSNLRAILSKMTVEEINEDRESFNGQVTQIAQRQLDEMGFKITSLGLTDLRDADEDNGYLENLGRPRIAEVRKQAEIAEANSQRETRMHVARTDQEAKEEEYKRESTIAQSRKDKDIKDAAFKEETERARAQTEQSYELERAKLAKEVQEEDLLIKRRAKEEELDLNHIEKERLVKLEDEEAKVRKAKADAQAYETTKHAEAEAQKSSIAGEAQARIKKEEGFAEAEVIREKGRAEAESRRLLAEAMQEHGDTIIVEKMIEMLPLFAEKIAAPMNNIDSVKIIDSGNGQSVPSFGKSVTQTMMDMQEPLKELTGFDVSNMLSSIGKEKSAESETEEISSEEEQESVSAKSE